MYVIYFEIWNLLLTTCKVNAIFHFFIHEKRGLFIMEKC